MTHNVEVRTNWGIRGEPLTQLELEPGSFVEVQKGLMDIFNLGDNGILRGGSFKTLPTERMAQRKIQKANITKWLPSCKSLVYM